ncbi:glycine betaine uptake BCCT transporter [Alkalihalobacillus sp. CinArs1]|uniref:glycine betaine uptake BCCT transporter n=1 Tax=Alkalihalobacillus sp. CinArs1 TaxID=2995314 RepID=UPI0022DE797C|nr:BCCT family transporter [Alkalihalobacillus sp. CinArs1]
MDKVTKVFWIGIAIAIVFVGWGVIMPGNLDQVMTTSKSFFLNQFGWFYQLAATFFLIFAIYLIFSRFGNIKLGKDSDKPEYNRLTWFAMLFSAGMGIGLLFFGVSEPMSHFSTPPLGGEGGTVDAAHQSLRYTYLHWGFHAWAIYATIALALAYYKFRKGAPGLISATLYPLLGDRVKGPIGITIDIIAVFATIFGVAASLGLGAQQINGGLAYLTDIPNNFTVQLIIIAVITVLFTISAGTGIKKGIKYLSNTNMILAVLLLGLFIFLGPTKFILDLFVTTFGEYVQNIFGMGMRLAPMNPENESWVQGWTIFYWAWWIAWSPFVGTFIARVSRGRTIREFMIAVTVVPTVVCAFWFGVFGGSAIFFDFNQGTDIAGQGLETALFYLYEQVPLGGILTVVTLLLISTFFITSADSATFVLGMQTTNGSLNPPNFVKFSWGFVLAASAVVLMITGGLQSMQTAIIVSAFPLTIILLFTCWGMIKSFSAEVPRKQRSTEKKTKAPKDPKTV